jgi:hypothetical protein
VATERNKLIISDFGHDPSRGAPPEAIGSVVSWLVTEPEADTLRAETVHGQELAATLGLLPGRVGT